MGTKNTTFFLEGNGNRECRLGRGLVDSVVAKHICISGLWKPENVDQNEFRSCQNVKCLSAFTRISLPTCSFFLDSALTNFPCSMSFL